jgi:hypothetical protein
MLFTRGGWELKKVSFFLVVLASIVWLSCSLATPFSFSWFLAYCVLLALVGGPYFASKLFFFLTAFIGGKNDINK